VVGSGLLVAVTRLTGAGERGGVPGAGLVRLAGGQQGFPSALSDCLPEEARARGG